MRPQTRFFHLSVSGFLGLALIFLSGCNPEMSEICTSKYDHAVTDVISQLESLKNSEKNSGSAQRNVASLTSVGSSQGLGVAHMESNLSEDEREDWQSWSQSELKRVEAYLDWTTLHRDEALASEKTRRHLTDIANRLVAFHGYAHEGRISRMLDTLKAVEADRKEIQALVCRAN